LKHQDLPRIDTVDLFAAGERDAVGLRAGDDAGDFAEDIADALIARILDLIFADD